MPAPTAIRLELIVSDRTKAAFDSVAARAKAAGARIATALKAAAIGVAVASSVSKVKGALNEMNQLNDLAQQVGVSATFLQRFTGAMGQAGINTNTQALVGSMQKLNAALVNTEKLKAFEKLGIDVSHLKGLKPEQAFMGFLEVVSKIPDEQTRILALQRGLEEQGLRFAPLMRQGPDAFKQSLQDVMAMIPVTSDNTVTLATNANNAFAMVAQGMSSAWHEILGAILAWADESFGGVDLAIMKTWENSKAFCLTFVRALQTLGESIGGIVALFSLDWVDAIKMIGLRMAQFINLISGPLMYIVKRVAALINEDWAASIEHVQDQVTEWLDSTADSIYEKHGVAPMKGMLERIEEDFAHAKENIEVFRKGLAAKPLLATGVTVSEMPDMKPLETAVSKSTKEGVKQGLVDGIEAGSYEALKTVFEASAQSISVPKVNLAPKQPPAPTVASKPVESTAQERNQAEKLTSIEFLLRQILDASRASSASLAALGTF